MHSYGHLGGHVLVSGPKIRSLLDLGTDGAYSVFVYGLTDGGPGGLVYGYIFCWLGYFAVVASLAELVSM